MKDKTKIINRDQENLGEEYLQKSFPDLPLESPLFYNAKAGIRFELGSINLGNVDAAYFKNVNARAVTLFEHIFEENSDLLLVVKSYEPLKKIQDSSKETSLFHRYIKDKDLLHSIDFKEEKTAPIEVRTEATEEFEDDFDGPSYQYILSCKREQVDYQGILAAKANMDFAIEPSIKDEVFFVHTEKNIIFYMYDDRGADVVSNEKTNLMDLYRKFNDWILDYDRKKIDRIFKG